jgi:hypothetical protein
MARISGVMGTRKAGRFWSVRAPAPLSSAGSESGTFVPCSKTLRAQGGRAFYRRPFFASLVPACHFDIHTAIMAYPGTERKPSIGFQARFFLEGLDRRWSLQGNGLQREKSQKTGETQKKVQNNFRGTPVFLQNGPVFGPKTGLVCGHSL